jgi:HSP20 family protein
MLNLWDSWQELDRLRSEMDRLFGRYAAGAPSEQGVVVRPVMRLQETEEAYRVSVDLPGVPSEAIEVEAQGQGLRVRAIRGGADAGYEARYEQFLTLPQGVDADRIEGRHVDGVLELTIPKPEQVKPRRVEIASGAGQRPASIEAGEPARERELAGATG